MIHSSSTVIFLFSLQLCVGVHSLFIASVDSGHGGQVKDETGKECDGMDEVRSKWCNYLISLLTFLPKLLSVIFPVDFQATSQIIDNVCGNFYSFTSICRI